MACLRDLALGRGQAEPCPSSSPLSWLPSLLSSCPPANLDLALLLLDCSLLHLQEAILLTDKGSPRNIVTGSSGCGSFLNKEPMITLK